MRVGGNLFHSFEDFSVSSGGTAYFNNPLTIDNIISRVTGQSASTIDGLLKANGRASFFLINPNGIIFGPSAQLDLGGSFLASTARSLKFADGSEFSTIDPLNAPPLTISVPVGLQFGENVGTIQNRSQVTQLVDFPNDDSPALETVVGLQVQPNRTLALIGGDIVLERGALSAGNLVTQGGRVELGSVANKNFVRLIPVEQGWTLEYDSVQDFQDIQLSQGALIDASGADGNIQIHAQQVTLTQGSQIGTVTNTEQPSGTLAIHASESVELSGVGEMDFPSGLFTQVNEGGSGIGGNLTIQTKRLAILDGAVVSAGTRGNGAGGRLLIDASESVELKGTGPDLPSLLTTSTTSTGAAGDLVINTKRLIMRDGARVEVVTLDQAQGGNLTINASEFVELVGAGVFDDGTQSVSAASAASGVEGLLFQPTGDSGGLEINTGQLVIRDGAEVAVNSLGSGGAGDLRITSRSISLDAQGQLTAAAASGNGGNIQLQVADSLQLRQGSQISARAGGIGDGGNIGINSRFLIAAEESNITASALQGQGGNIQIAAQGLFLSPNSMITASSELGIDGVVQINTPEVDPKSSLVELPVEVLDVTTLVSRECGGSGNIAAGEFIVTGRGGLPLGPDGLLSSGALLADLGSATDHLQPDESPKRTPGTPASSSTEPYEIVEAQGWVVDTNGEVTLTPHAPAQTHQPWLTAIACHDS